MAGSDQQPRSKARKGAPSPEQLQAQHLLAADEASETLAWRLLSSPRTFLVLAGLLSLFWTLASFVPQRPLLSELAEVLPFAWAEAAHALGLTNALVAWPALLSMLLMVLNGGGMALAAWQRAHDPQQELSKGRFSALDFDVVASNLPQSFAKRPIAPQTHGESPKRQLVVRRGLMVEGVGLVILGLVALACSLAYSTTQKLDYRMTLVPGSQVLAESEIRDGDTYLLRAFPLQMLCDRADPQDVLRRYPCKVALNGEPTQQVLTPGETTTLDSFHVELVRESLRAGRDDEAIDLILKRDQSVQRLRIDPGETVALANSSEQLTAFHGPDGPLVVLKQEGQAPVLLSPKVTFEAHAAASALSIEAEHPSRLILRAYTVPAQLGMLLGVLLVVLGFALCLLSPHLFISLTEATPGVRLKVVSFNRPRLAALLRAQLLNEPAPSPSTSAKPLFDEIGLLLAAGGLTLGLLASAHSFALPLGVAAVVAFRSGFSLPLGLLTLVAGVSTVPASALHLDLQQLMPHLLSGAALGFVAREMGQRGWFKYKPALLSGLSAVGLALSLAAWPTFMWLAQEGDLLRASVAQMDPDSARHLLLERPLFMPATADLWVTLAFGVSVVAGIWLLAVHLSQKARGPEVTPHALLSPRVASILMGVMAVVGLGLGLRWLLLSFSSVPLESETLRQSLQNLVNRETSLLGLQLPSEASLALWSRPIVEPLCLAFGLGFVLLALRKPSAPTEGQGLAGHFWPIAALLALTLSLAFSFAEMNPISGMHLAQLASTILLAASLVASPPRQTALSTLPLLLVAGLLSVSWLFVPLFSAP